MIPYSLRNLKILQIENHVQDKTNLTNSEIKELFQDLMFKSTGIYVHCDQVTSDVSLYKSINSQIVLYWDAFCENCHPKYSNHISKLNMEYYFNINEITKCIREDINLFFYIINQCIYGIIKSDMYQNSGLCLDKI